MIKLIVLSIGLILSTAAAARAETITPLKSPANAQTQGLHATCNAVRFGPYDNPSGTCEVKTNGRNFSGWIYAVRWNDAGMLTGLTQCATYAWNKFPAYAPGYTAATCAHIDGNVGPFVLIGPYYYTITGYSADGAYEAATGNTGPVLVAF